jgi:hypothetical protein
MGVCKVQRFPFPKKKYLVNSMDLFWMIRCHVQIDLTPLKPAGLNEMSWKKMTEEFAA